MKIRCNATNSTRITLFFIFFQNWVCCGLYSDVVYLKKQTVNTLLFKTSFKCARRRLSCVFLPKATLNMQCNNINIFGERDLLAIFHVIKYDTKCGTFGYSGHFSWYKNHLFYYILVGYSGQSDIVARK